MTSAPSRAAAWACGTSSWMSRWPRSGRSTACGPPGSGPAASRARRAAGRPGARRPARRASRPSWPTEAARPVGHPELDRAGRRALGQGAAAGRPRRSRPCAGPPARPTPAGPPRARGPTCSATQSTSRLTHGMPSASAPSSPAMRSTARSMETVVCARGHLDDRLAGDRRQLARPDHLRRVQLQPHGATLPESGRPSPADESCATWIVRPSSTVARHRGAGAPGSRRRQPGRPGPRIRAPVGHAGVRGLDHEVVDRPDGVGGRCPDLEHAGIVATGSPPAATGGRGERRAAAEPGRRVVVPHRGTDPLPRLDRRSPGCRIPAPATPRHGPARRSRAGPRTAPARVARRRRRRARPSGRRTAAGRWPRPPRRPGPPRAPDRPSSGARCGAGPPGRPAGRTRRIGDAKTLDDDVEGRVADRVEAGLDPGPRAGDQVLGRRPRARGSGCRRCPGRRRRAPAARRCASPGRRRRTGRRPRPRPRGPAPHPARRPGPSRPRGPGPASCARAR